MNHYLLALTLLYSSFATSQSQVTTKIVDATTIDLHVTIAIPEHAHVYRDYITVSVDNPAVVISEWTTPQEPRSLYDTTFKTTKKVFEKNLTLSLQAHATTPCTQEAQLHIAYYLSSNKGIVEEIFPLSFSPTPPQDDLAATHQKPALVTTIEVNETVVRPESKPSISYTDRLSALIQHTNSLWVRLFLVLLLGILMSLTPCIYPMIPITVGILQSQGSSSMLRNLVVSLCYTLGIATTFALLGLAAAATGQMFGTFMANPFVILFIVALLAYLGLAMFGCYEMYVPTFLKPRSTQSGNGSLLSAFLFGAASGSVASPCLSPGLVLLLSIVTKLNSTSMGFILLFTFGVGLSLPLLIIGTFSSSLSLLPRAGMWMIEVKKFFGFMLFGMCLYFLRPIVPTPILLSMVAIFLLSAGLFYLYSGSKKSGVWRSLYGILGIFLIAASIVIATQAYKAYLMADECTLCSTWQTNYAQTLRTAQTCKKKLFIDVGATFCSLCTAIDKKVLDHPDVTQALQHFCCVKINGADDPENVCALLQEKYNVVGFPTFLLIDAQTGTLIKRWGGELYDIPCAEFAAELTQLANA